MKTTLDKVMYKASAVLIDIRLVKIIGSSKHTVTTENGFRNARVSDSTAFFDTYAEAKAWIVSRREKELLMGQSRIACLIENLERAKRL